VWGDSHMAAGFFTEELSRLAGVRDTLAQPRLLPAGFGHAGVRGLVRRVCVAGPWVRESAHASAAAARQPGPGLVSLVNTAPGGELAWDLRDANGEPRHRQVRVLLAPSAAGVALEVSVDGAASRTVLLGSDAVGSVLELNSSGGALSVLRLRVLEGTLRVQGLQLGEPSPAADALQIDLYGYPGATVAGWAQADAAAHAAWFTDRRYDLVVLAYGTNEANAPAFRVEDYRAQLARAVARLRERFPQAQCLLVAPGDRGVRVPRKRGSASASSRARPDLLRYARLHAQVATVQHEVAQAAGCAAWSMQAAMGGAGSAYRWARQQPAWMAPDLIHFSPAGYRELARRLAAELGWVVP
jgi:lysophospholipase L1-like esterase